MVVQDDARVKKLFMRTSTDKVYIHKKKLFLQLDEIQHHTARIEKIEGKRERDKGQLNRERKREKIRE